MRTLLILASATMMLAWSSTASADAPRTTPRTTPPPTTPPPTTTAPHTPPGTPPAAPWRDVYHAGRVAFDAGRLDEALADFVRAAELGGPPSSIYDQALTLDRLGRTREAIAAYHRYLDALPEAPNRDLVEARLGELEPPASGLASHVATPPSPILVPIDEPTPPTSAAPSRSTPPAPTSDHWEAQGPEWAASWVMLALTAATSVAAGLVWNDGLDRFHALQDACASAAGCTQAEVDGSAAHDEQDATNVLLGVSIGLGALTVLTFVVEGVVTGNRLRFVRGDVASRDGVHLGFGPMGLSIAGTF